MSEHVVYPWSKVYINNVDYGLHPVTVSAAVANDMPGRLNFGSGITQRTGKIDWDRVAGRSGLLLSPYRRADDTGMPLPRVNDRVRVVMGVQDDDPRHYGFKNGETVFTGKVDYTTVESAGYPVTHIVDDIDRLNRVVRLPAYKHHMPPLAGWTGWYRHTNLTPDTVLSWLAYRCGFHVHPLPLEAVYLSAHLQGSSIPTSPGWGTVLSSAKTRGNQRDLLVFRETATGLALAEGAIDYEPANRNSITDRIVFSFQVGAAHAGTTVIFLNINNNQTELRVVVNGNRRVDAHVGSTVYPGLTPAPDGYAHVAFTRDGRVVIAVDGESRTANTHAWTPGRLSGISIDANPNARIAGINIFGTRIDDTRVHAVGFKPTAYINCGYPYPLHLSRSIRDEKAINVIEEITSAICCTVHIDGEGKLNITYGRSAHGRPTMGVLTTKKQIRGFSIKEDSQLAARDVLIKYKTIEGDFTNIGEGSYVTLWEGSNKQLDANETLEEFIGPAADEEWLEVDKTFTYANQDDNARLQFVRKNGSFMGFTIVEGKAGSRTERWGGGLTSIQEIVPWRFKITMRPHNASSTHIPELDTIHASMWGKGMPVVRGGALARMVEADPYRATGGSANAADLTHDAGPWVTDTRAKDIGDYAMSKSISPLPIISGIECFFNPQIKVNTRWNLDLRDTVGVLVLCFILGVDHDPAADTTRLTVRVMEDLSPWVWDNLPQLHRNFRVVKDSYISNATLKAGGK